MAPTIGCWPNVKAVVYLDGKPAEIVRINQIMRGVLLPAGDHRIVFRFQPASLRLGLWLSLAGVVVCIGLLLAARFVSSHRRV